MFRIFQFLMWLSGICFVAWSLFGSRFRDAEGFLKGGFCLPVSICIALFILSFAVKGRLKRSAFWFALTLVGQAVALQLINAGPIVRYQHYKSFDRILTDTNPLLMIFLVVQTILVVVGFKRVWVGIRRWIGKNFKIWQLLTIGAVFGLSSATVSRELSIYTTELPFATFIQTLNLASIVLMVWYFPEEMLVSLKRTFDKLLRKTENAEGAGSIDRFAIIAAVWVTSIAIILSIVSYEKHPHVPDEVGYLYHAKYFNEGMLAMPAPLVPDAFDIDLMTYEDNRWYSPVPPGWPAVLSLGILIEKPWLVNPILAGICMLLIYMFISETYNKRSARIALILLCMSPWYIFMAMNFMTHTLSLTCTMIALLSVVRARNSGKVKWGWIGGFSLGMVCMTRPLEGVIIAGLIGLWSIGFGGKRLKLSAIVGLVVGAIIIGSLALAYNNALTGDPLKFPLMAYFDKYYGPKTNALGFGPERGYSHLGWSHDPYPGHGLKDVLVNANLNTFLINIDLFGWCTGSIFLIAVILFSGAMRRNDYLMLVIIGAIIGIHTFYWFSGGPDFGARYWYLTIVPCVVLTVRGMQRLSDMLGTISYRDTRVLVGVLSLGILAIINFFPWRAIDKYHHYRGMRPDIRSLSREYGFGKSLVLIRGNRGPDYVSASIYNPIDLSSDVPVYAWDRNTKVRNQLLQVYQDRPIWVVDGPSKTNKGFKVIAGPISAQKLIKAKNDK